jgi:hypothetical protein
VHANGRLIDVDGTLADTGGEQEVAGTATPEALVIRRPTRRNGLG